MPKKGNDLDIEIASPSNARFATFGNEDNGRLVELESRVLGLEDRLANVLEDVQESRSREMGMMKVMREVIAHLATSEKGKPKSLKFWLMRKG